MIPPASTSESGRVYDHVPQLKRLREEVLLGDAWKLPLAVTSVVRGLLRSGLHTLGENAACVIQHRVSGPDPRRPGSR